MKIFKKVTYLNIDGTLPFIRPFSVSFQASLEILGVSQRPGWDDRGYRRKQQQARPTQTRRPWAAQVHVSSSRSSASHPPLMWADTAASLGIFSVVFLESLCATMEGRKRTSRMEMSRRLIPNVGVVGPTFIKTEL